MTTTTTAASTTSTTKVTTAAASALLTSLNTGSGVDTDALVKGLVEAQFAAKTAQLTARSEKLTAQLSGVSKLKSAITDFATAFENLVKGGTLQSQPVSANASVVTATALPGAQLYGRTASIQVDRLASAQAAVSTASVASKTTAIGTGTFTLKIGTATTDANGAWTGVTAPDADGDGAEDIVTITIGSGQDTLTGIAAAINAAKSGVTASVVTDADGAAYLSLKGATGAASAFTLTSADAGLSQFNVEPGASGMAVTASAGNAALTVDGIQVQRASNSISDLVDGMKLDLTGTSTAPVGITTSTPTTALSNAVEDFVFTYNQVLGELKTLTDPISGELRSDTGAQNLLRSLKGLTLKDLAPGSATGTLKTLAQIGVGTARDGTLMVNATTLAGAIRDNPGALEAMFSASSDGSGLMAAMNSVKLNASSTLYGLGASTTRYNEAQSQLTKQQDKLTDQSEKMSTRLTQQFASMNARVAAYKSTMTFMENQIKAWANQGNN